MYLFCICFPNQLNALKNIENITLMQSSLHSSSCEYCCTNTESSPLYAASIFPGIAGRQTGKKNDQHALLTPLRSESYTQGCGYYLSSSKSACLVIIRAWDRNLS